MYFLPPPPLGWKSGLRRHPHAVQRPSLPPGRPDGELIRNGPPPPLSPPPLPPRPLRPARGEGSGDGSGGASKPRVSTAAMGAAASTGLMRTIIAAAAAAVMAVVAAAVAATAVSATRPTSRQGLAATTPAPWRTPSLLPGYFDYALCDGGALRPVNFTGVRCPCFLALRAPSDGRVTYALTLTPTRGSDTHGGDHRDVQARVDAALRDANSRNSHNFLSRGGPWHVELAVAATVDVQLSLRPGRKGGGAAASTVCNLTLNFRAEPLPAPCPTADIRAAPTVAAASVAAVAAGNASRPTAREGEDSRGDGVSLPAAVRPDRGARLDRPGGAADGDAVIVAATVALGTLNLGFFSVLGSGTLIAPRFVLTLRVPWPEPQTNLDVRFMTQRAGGAAPVSDRDRWVAHAVPHPTVDNLEHAADLMLWRLDRPAPEAVIAALWPPDGPPRLVVNHNTSIPSLRTAVRWAGHSAVPLGEPVVSTTYSLADLPPRFSDRVVAPADACRSAGEVRRAEPPPYLCTAPVGGLGGCVACPQEADSGGPVYQVLDGRGGGGAPRTVLLVGVLARWYVCQHLMEAGDVERHHNWVLRTASVAGWIDAVVGAPTGAVNAATGVRAGPGDGQEYPTGPVYMPAADWGGGVSTTTIISSSVAGGVAVLAAAAGGWWWWSRRKSNVSTRGTGGDSLRG